MAGLLPETASFQAAVGLINKVDVAKFPAVVTRLLKKLHLKVRTDACRDGAPASLRVVPPSSPCSPSPRRRGCTVQGPTFTDDEKQQLGEMFGLNTEQLATVLEGCTFMLEQFAYNVTKPDNVTAALTKAGLSEEHTQAVSQVYASEAEAVLTQMRGEQFGPNALDSVSWKLNLQSSEDTQGRLAQPTVVMELGIRSVDASDDGDGAVQHVAIEATHDELHGVFENLERLQEQLDAIS